MANRMSKGSTQRVAANNTDDVRELIQSMDFSEETLAQALLEQPKLFLQAARYRVGKLKALLMAETSLDEIELDTANRIRLTERPEGKITEKYIEQETERDPSVVEARHARDEAKAMDEWSKLLLDAFRERGSMAKALVQLIGAEAALESGYVRQQIEMLGISKLKDKVKSRFPNAGE